MDPKFYVIQKKIGQKKIFNKFFLVSMGPKNLLLNFFYPFFLDEIVLETNF